jgi:hypothetical protein
MKASNHMTKANITLAGKAAAASATKAKAVAAKAVKHAPAANASNAKRGAQTPLTQYCVEHGLSPKLVRAKLRRNGLNAPYDMANAALRTALDLPALKAKANGAAKPAKAARKR